ncbi:hypothetical protein [Marimonas lutisalis]|uniref:hypothetical protein n=1 Tax=Marimonas lutisalis TaxID=2545756 RepID=UPI0010F8B2E0|nr:hypothetical protein [Marimonas lutisalis]
MKTAFAAFGTALVLATSASAMVGPYERAINDKAAMGQLGSGMLETVEVRTQPASPNADWRASGEKTVTVFDADNTTSANKPGPYSR